MKELKEDILKISKRLESDEIDYKQARKDLSALFGVRHKPLYKGRAIVRSKRQGWIYEGHELIITGVYMIHSSKTSAFPKGTREFYLSLEGTKFEEMHGHKYTIIPETDLEILELEEY